MNFTIFLTFSLLNRKNWTSLIFTKIQTDKNFVYLRSQVTHGGGCSVDFCFVSKSVPEFCALKIQGVKHRYVCVKACQMCALK